MTLPGVKDTNAGKGRGRWSASPVRNKTTRLVVYEPRSFDDVQSIVNQLKNKRPVILNLKRLKAIARRITDFVGGAVYALMAAYRKSARQ